MFKRLFLNNKFIAFIIMLNTVVLFFDAFDKIERDYPLLFYIDLFINLIFFIEMFVKISVYKWKNYIKSSWNKMDFIINMILIVVLISTTSEENIMFVTIFRTLRAIKIFKLFKYIPNISHLIRGIKKALKSSIFVFYAFFVYLFLVSFISCLLFKKVEPQYFGHPIISFYSCFKIFTIEGWDGICESVASHYEGTHFFLIKLYFMIIVLSGGVFGLSILNAIFVDEMVSDNNDELNEKIDQLTEQIKILNNKINS